MFPFRSGDIQDFEDEIMCSITMVLDDIIYMEIVFGTVNQVRGFEVLLFLLH